MMILSAKASQFLFYGSLVMIGVGMLATFVVFSLRSSREIAAKKEGLPRPARSILFWVAPLAIVAGGLAQIFAYGYNVDVWLVTDSGYGTPTAEHGIARSIDSDLTEVKSDHILDRLWVINRSSHDVRIETVHYGPTYAFGERIEPTPPLRIPPGSVAHVMNVDYVGPDDNPASQVLGDRQYGASRAWLTW
jgi:hypothetical protein